MYNASKHVQVYAENNAWVEVALCLILMIRVSSRAYCYLHRKRMTEEISLSQKLGISDSNNVALFYADRSKNELLNYGKLYSLVVEYYGRLGDKRLCFRGFKLKLHSCMHV